jgi:HK97 family phage prohead protease
VNKINGNFIKSNGQLIPIPYGIIEQKSISSPAMISDVDEAKKTVTGYASIFGNKDLDDDIILPGAFAKSIAENGPNGTNSILFLWQHNPGKVLAKPTVLKEDAKGLYYEATITSGATFAEDALKLIAAGLVEENSIGYQTVKSAIMQPDAQDWESWYRELYEVNLYEHSAVTWGANPEARMTGVKAMGKKELQSREAKLMKALRVDGMSDETYQKIELSLKQINTEYFNLGKAISLSKKGAAYTCPSCKATFSTDPDNDGDNDSNVLTDNDGDMVECPECKCMFQKSTPKEQSRKSLINGFDFTINNQLVTGFNF